MDVGTICSKLVGGPEKTLILSRRLLHVCPLIFMYNHCELKSAYPILQREQNQTENGVLILKHKYIHLEVLTSN